jgi:very-short-patch-repair endonuclease
VCRGSDDRCPKFDTPSLDRRIAALVGRQHGVIASRQLVALGMHRRAVGHRVAAGRLHRVHQGVYAVGHTVLSTHGYWMAAVLACGPGAALSHASAAALWGIRPTAAERTEVTVPGTSGRARPRLWIHRSRSFGPTEVTTRHGIPVTTPGRTVLDMAARLSESRLENLLNEVERRELTDYPSLHALARAHAGHRGAPKLLKAMQTHEAGTKLTKSDLELLFRQLCRDHGLPEPWVNHTIHGKTVDFLFAHHTLLVEADSWAYHKTRRSFEDDRARDVITAQAGYRTVRFTDRQLTHDPASVARALRTLLRCAAPSLSPQRPPPPSP